MSKQHQAAVPANPRENTMSDRDELFQLILGRTTTKAVERILAAGYRKPRTVTTVEELDALPELSVIRNPDWVWERSESEWFGAGSEQATPPRNIFLPATVLYAPEPQP
jgi:hypothetical protein